MAADSDYEFSCGPLYRFTSPRPALDLFIERFVDAFSPEVDVNDGRAGAIRAAADIRMFSPQISDAFEAVSVTFFGRSIGDRRIEASGMRLYPKVLRSLQAALLDPERSRAESTLVTVTLLMAFEVSRRADTCYDDNALTVTPQSIERTTPGSISAHVMGAMRLIQHRGPENHMYGVEHLLFTELRPYWVCVCPPFFRFISFIDG